MDLRLDDRAGERGSGCGANDDRLSIELRMLCEREIKERARVFRRLVVLGVTRDADDLDGVSVELKLLAERVDIRPQLPREGLVDDPDRRCTAAVTRFDLPALAAAGSSAFRKTPARYCSCTHATRQPARERPTPSPPCSPWSR